MSELETRSATAEDIAEMRQVAEDIVAEMRQKLETCGRKASIGFTVSANAVSVVLSVLISLGGAFLIMFYLRKYLLLLLLHGPGAPAVSGVPSLSTTWRQTYCVRSYVRNKFRKFQWAESWWIIAMRSKLVYIGAHKRCYIYI